MSIQVGARTTPPLNSSVDLLLSRNLLCLTLMCINGPKCIILRTTCWIVGRFDYSAQVIMNIGGQLYNFSRLEGLEPLFPPFMFPSACLCSCQGVVHQARAVVSPLQLSCPSHHTLCQTSPILPVRMSSMMQMSSTRAVPPPNTA